MRGLVQCHVQNCKILKIMVGGRGVAVRGIKFCRGPRKLHFVELSIVVAPRKLHFVELSFVVAPRSYISWN